MCTKKPTKEDVETFLNNGIKMMKSEKTTELLSDKKGCPRPGQKLIELQRAEWDPLNIDRDLGCQYLDEVPKHWPGDQALEDLRDDFIQTAMHTYLGCLEGRRTCVTTLSRQLCTHTSAVSR